MNEETFKVGDIVAFKTGNVPMTVISISGNDLDVVFVVDGRQYFKFYKKETLRHFKECDVIILTPKKELTVNERNELLKQLQSFQAMYM